MALNMAKIESKTDPLFKTIVNVLELKLFVHKKLDEGANVVALVPYLKKKLSDLCSEHLEMLDQYLEKGLINEGRYLECANSTKEEHNQTALFIDLLNLGIVIKCNII